ncbi:MAG: Coenzyme F420 hydrogenase/dehydrogenase, beta subunit C-terminal domain [Gammaproteobacteria bacterium]|nr:Coenzyme F420 hydrogenase/dehydrogenase, beta subunit C-terminal domain [Gammaproteobacteria bacterium]
MNTPYRNRYQAMMNDVVAAGACSACGACVTVCPHNVIVYDAGQPRRRNAKTGTPFDACEVSEGVGCDLCAAVCPRLWPRETHLRDVVFADDRPYEGIFGIYRHIFVARARQPEAGAQDGGVVTALLAWARQADRIDGAVVAAVGDGDRPCLPTPKVATTVAEIKASAGSWYTYCPNPLALAAVRKRKLERVAFVGVPCQITPLRKMEFIDPGVLISAKKVPEVVSRHRGFLRGQPGRVAFSVGLFCTEVFTPELMTERIERQLGIPLAEITKVNVKGEIRISCDSGAMARIPLDEAMQGYQRPECRHCGDFSAELADFSCGGVGTDGATIVVLRTHKAVELWRDFEASGAVETWPIAEHRKAWNILLRLARQQRGRVPLSPAAATLPQYAAHAETEAAMQILIAAGKTIAEIEASMAAACGDEPLARQRSFRTGTAIPNDPGDPAAGEKRLLPPPPPVDLGGGTP